MSVAEKEASGLRHEINQMGNNIANLRDELKKSQVSTQKIVSEYEKQISTLTTEKNTLQNKLQEAMTSSDATHAKVSNELEAMKNKIEELEKYYKKQLFETEENKKKTIETMQEKHRLELEAKDATLQVAVDMAALKQSQLENDIETIKKEYEKRCNELMEQHSVHTQQLTASHQTETNDLKAIISTLEGQITSLSETADGEKGTLKNQLTAAENKTKSLQKELENKKKDNERNESVCTSLKNQVESLREELKATQKAFRDKMDASLAQVEADWQAKLDEQVAASTYAVNDALKQSDEAHALHLNELLRNHEIEVNVLKNALQQEASQAASELTKAEQERIRLENELKKEKDERQKEVVELIHKYKNDKSVTESSFAADMDKLRKDLTGQYEEREKLLVKAHEAEMNRLQALVAHTQSEMKVQIEETILKCNAQADDARKVALNTLESQLKQEANNARNEQVKVHNQVFIADFLLTHSFTYSLTHLLTHSLTHLLLYSGSSRPPTKP